MSLSLCGDSSSMFRGAVAGGVDYLESNPEIKSLVIGISGGVDSAVTVTIASECCAEMKYRGRHIHLIGAHLHMDGNKDEDYQRSKNILSKYCDRYVITDLDDIYYKVIDIDETISRKNKESLGLEDIRQIEDDDLELSPSERIRAGNIKARIRMMFLYNLASSSKGMVLSTDNLTEYNLGFWTLHGDVGDFGFIQNLWKTEVFEMANFIGGPVRECINTPPTDGLGVTDTSLDQILPGWRKHFKDHIEAYRYVDNVLINFVEKDKTDNKDHPVIKRHLSTKFKRVNPYNISRAILTWTHNRLN